MHMFEALRYPMLRTGWQRRVLPLALVQLIPIIGQMILIGYAMAVVRAVFAQQDELPPIQWLRTLRDGAFICLTGFMYLVPLLGITTLLTQVNASRGAEGILLLILALAATLTFNGLIGRLPIKNKAMRRVATLIGFVISALFMSFTFNSLTAVPAAADAPSLGIFGTILSLVVAALVFTLAILLHIGGLRQAIENKGLLDPIANLKFLMQDRPAAFKLIFNMLGVLLITLVATGVGLVLLVLPGLMALVIGVLALWYLLARFGMAHTKLAAPAAPTPTALPTPISQPVA
jgi:Protein of unknown function (DUF4013)